MHTLLNYFTLPRFLSSYITLAFHVAATRTRHSQDVFVYHGFGLLSYSFVLLEIIIVFVFDVRLDQWLSMGKGSSQHISCFHQIKSVCCYKHKYL